MPSSSGGFFGLWLTLFVTWLILNAALTAEILISGLVITLPLTFAFRSYGVWSHVRWNPRILVAYLLYMGVFLRELIKANLNVAGIVFSPHLEIHPGIVEITTRLKSPVGRMVLANSITLTPGTLTVDIQGDRLFIHWINVGTQDREAATREIAAVFEKHLEVIYG